MNPIQEVNDSSIIRQLQYDHPMFNAASIATQPGLENLNGKGAIFYCGSYFKYGFHEDAASSGVRVAEHFGVKL